MIHALPTVMFVLLEEEISMRVEWKSATTDNGEQSVMIHGTQQMLVWFVDSLVTQDLVSFILMYQLCSIVHIYARVINEPHISLKEV